MADNAKVIERPCGYVLEGPDDGVVRGVVRGEDHDEVLGKAAQHAADAHGITEVDADLERALVGAIEPV